MNTTFLMATFIPPDASEELAEAEGVKVVTDPVTVTFELDTGERIVLDRQELALAIQGRGQLREAA